MRWIICLVVFVLVGTVTAETKTSTVKKIKTLPMVKLGDKPNNVKGVPLRPIQAKPPTLSPYDWIVVPDTATNAANWTLSSGTNVAATLVKFNKYTVVLLPEDERERQYPRSALSKEGQQRINAFEKQNHDEMLQAWQDAQAAKQAEKDLAAP